jgi:hypothetical protein
MTTERRKAPRRAIVSIEKIGAWGQLTYQHKLSCGHIDVRKRKASSSDIACMWCLRAKEKQVETRIEKTRAAIASRIGVPMEAVDVASEDINGQLVIRSAVVYLSSRDVIRIAGE